MGLAVAACAVAANAPSIVAAVSGQRTIALYNIHTKETVSVAYKQDGKFVPEAMEKINWVLRDWRRNEPAKMDPALIDLLWEVHSELGSSQPIHIISGFRSRATNDMLRKTVGGQASESRHILGKAADVYFPDVPLKKLRYSALIRERGGVGYYPTSATPFVHIDTDRVRHWPRLPRHELALLFPEGKSQHVPADGNPIGREDVRVAQSRHKDLAVQVAEFHDLRRNPRPATLVADLTQPKPLAPPVAQPAQPKRAEARVASLAPVAIEPRLVAEPRMVERPSRFSQRQPSEADRNGLTDLVALAAAEFGSKLAPSPSAPTAAKRVAALDPAAVATPAEDQSSVTDAGRLGFASGWAQAPAFDEEHPDELSYRPFPLAPYLTESASPDDPALTRIIHPDASRSLEMLDLAQAVLPMSFTPGEQVGALLWAQQFQGAAVGYETLGSAEGKAAAMRGGSLPQRPVKTSSR